MKKTILLAAVAAIAFTGCVQNQPTRSSAYSSSYGQGGYNRYVTPSYGNQSWSQPRSNTYRVQSYGNNYYKVGQTGSRGWKTVY